MFKRVGRRGAALILLGIIYLISGVPLLVARPVGTFKIFALHVWAAAFVTAGIAAIVAAFRRKPRGDRFGFVGLMLVGWLWTANCVLFFVLHLLNPVIPNLLSSAFGTGPLMILVAVIAGWSEPSEPVRLDPAEFEQRDRDD